MEVNNIRKVHHILSSLSGKKNFFDDVQFIIKKSTSSCPLKTFDFIPIEYSTFNVFQSYIV